MAVEGGHRNRERAGFYNELIGRFEEDGTPSDGSLLAYAAHELALGVLMDGVPARAHYESHYRQTGEMPAQLVPVECDQSVKYLWEYFQSINARRTFTEAGPNPVPHEGLEAWARMRNIQLDRFELGALNMLEQVYLSIASKRK